MAVAHLINDNGFLYVIIKGVVTSEFTDLLRKDFGVYRSSTHRWTTTISISRPPSTSSGQEWSDRAATLTEQVTDLFGSVTQEEFKSIVVFNKSDEERANELALTINQLRGCYAVPSATGELVEIFCFGEEARKSAVNAMTSLFGSLVRTKQIASKTTYEFR